MQCESPSKVITMEKTSKENLSSKQLDIGTIISVENSDSTQKYILSERIEDIGRGEGGWLCIDVDAITKSTISQFDCWRITYKYLDVQLKRGVIKIVEK